MPDYDTGAIRNLLTEVFPDADELEFFCEDYFKEVKFEADMALKKRAHLLTQYCAHNNQLDKLLGLLQKYFPAKYANSASLLLLQENAAGQEVLTYPPEEPQGQDVFISYSPKNLDFVKSLYQQLTSKGISAWFEKGNIEGATQWREAVVSGIINCKVFLLVLSPASAASANVRKEIDLADHHRKKILPLMWQAVNPLPPSIQYQLAGIQYLDFHEVPSEENFDQLTHVVQRLIGGVSPAEAASSEPIAKKLTIPIISKEETTQVANHYPDRSGHGNRLRKSFEISPIFTGINVMTKLVSQMGAFTTAEQDEINGELKWLFAAANHFLQIQQGEIERTVSVPVPIPPNTNKGYIANNTVLTRIDDAAVQVIGDQIVRIVRQMNIVFKNLAFELNKQAMVGGTVGSSISLMNSISTNQRKIAELTRELATLILLVYGVSVYAADDLINQLS